MPEDRESSTHMGGAGLKVLLVGGESAGIRTLSALAGTGHRLVGVMASPRNVQSNGGSLWAVARRMGYETWPAELVREPHFAKKVQAQGVDIILNVHSLYVISESVLGAARLGGFNLHPGPLPRYAGLNAVSWAIYRGECRYGVTVHEMTGTVDAGRIALQEGFELDESDTPVILTAKCVRAGVPLLLRLLDAAFTDPTSIPLIPQDSSQREYFGREVPQEGRLRWARSGRQIVNFVRACDYLPFPSPWGHPLARLDGRPIAITRASRTDERCLAPPGTVGRARGSSVEVACDDEWVQITEVMIDGRRARAADALKSGTRLHDG